MKSVQESKNELEASIRYAENAISSAKQTIESMEFRQEAAKKQYAEQTGREEALTKQVQELNATIQFHIDREAGFLDQIKELEREVQRQQDLGQGYYESMVGCMAELEKLRKEKEASSGPCGCQAYRDLEERATMPVIPKDVAIAIFREGVQSGINDAVAELEGQSITIEESEYCGDFEVSFSRRIDLDDELDLEWMRGKVGQYEEGFVTDALKGLCASKEFECRIHGVDDQGDDSKGA